MCAILIAVALLATPDFPDAIARDLQLQAAPQCTIFHSSDGGGAGTVVKPFGVYLVSRGLRPFDQDSLRNALLAAAGEHHSTNGSGITDVDALKAGADPNPASADALSPAFGCSSSGSSTALEILALSGWLHPLLARARARRRAGLT